MQPLTCLTEAEQFLQSEVKKFASEILRPRSSQMDADQALDPDIIPQCYAMGIMGIEVPEKFGGSEGSFLMSCIAIEEIAKVDPGVAVIVDVQNTLINNVFLNYADANQQRHYLPKLTSSKVGAFCLTEAESGSDAFALQTRAVQDGDYWHLNGTKIFITNASEAEVFIVFANANPSANYKGITAFVVDKDTSGLSLGKKEDKLGIRASSTCEVLLEDVKVPSSNVIGGVGRGYKIAIETLNEGRIGIAAQMLGLAEGAWEGAFRYAQERSQFGKTIDKFQAIQFQLAHLASQIECARLLVYNAARLKDAGQPFRKEAAMAKYMCSEIAEQVASSALEVYGGYGFIKDFPAEKFYRDVKIGKLYEGTSNLQLQTIFKLLQADQ